MKTMPKQIQIGLLIILALTAMAGCGSSKTPGAGFGSLDQSSTAITGMAAANDPNTAKAVCSTNSDTRDMQVNLMQYVDPYGQVRPDYVRLQFKKAPAGWQSGNWDLMIYRWTAAPDNSSSLDSTPMHYQFEKKVPAGFQVLTNYSYQYFNWAEVQQMAKFAGVSSDSPQAFANAVNLLVNLKDSTNSYQVLRIVFRSNGAVVSEADVLIPTFQANPAKYNADSRHPVTLQDLHPLKDKLGQSWTENNYFEFARSFCF